MATSDKKANVLEGGERRQRRRRRATTRATVSRVSVDVCGCLAQTGREGGAGEQNLYVGNRM